MTIDPILRIEAVLPITGDTRSTFYAKAQRGLFTRPIKISERAAGLPASEVAALNAARIRGAGEADIRALVERLHAARATAGAA